MKVVNAGVVAFPRKAWAHPCDRFFLSRSMKFCGVCGFAKVLHPKLLSCSSCGEEFVANDGERDGFSQCDEHANRSAK